MSTPAMARPMPAPDVLSAHLADETILLDLNTKHYFRLNESAAVIWRGVEQHDLAAALVARVLVQFDVLEGDAHDAVDALLADLSARGLITGGDRAP